MTRIQGMLLGISHAIYTPSSVVEPKENEPVYGRLWCLTNSRIYGHTNEGVFIGHVQIYGIQVCRKLCWIQRERERERERERDRER